MSVPAESLPKSRHSMSSGSRALLGVLLAAALLLLSVLAVGWPPQVRIEAPRLGLPWIDRPGGTMEIRFVSSLPLVLPGMELFLEGSGGNAAMAVKAQRWEATGAVVSVLLPTLPDGGYALRVRTTTQDLVLPKAVFLRRAWPAVLHIAQIADLPPPGRENLMRRFVAEMRLRRPDAVLVTGDINYTGSETNINFMHAELAALDAPVIMTAGNHEREAWHRYLRVFGARDHRTNFGPLAILSVDSAHGRDALTPSTFRWLSGELNRLGGRTAIVQMHHPIFPPGSTANSEAGGTGGYLHGYRQAFIDLCRQHKVALVLSGHWHQDAVFDSEGRFRADRSDFPGTKFVTTTALGADVRQVFDRSPVRNGYRWMEFVDGQLTSFSSDPRNPVPSTALGAP